MNSFFASELAQQAKSSLFDISHWGPFCDATLTLKQARQADNGAWVKIDEHQCKRAFRLFYEPARSRRVWLAFARVVPSTPTRSPMATSSCGALSQLPGGELLDKVRSKRAVIAVGASIVILSAFILALWPRLPSVFIALVLQGATGGFLGPAIAAISLGLVGHAALAERLGRNQRFASTGALAGAALMGLVGYLMSYQAIFLIVALLGLPLFVALARIRAVDIHFGRSCGAPGHHGVEQPPRTSRWILLRDSRLV